MERDILRLYQQRIDKYDELYNNISQEIEKLRVTQQEALEMKWENNRLSSEVSALRSDIADMRKSLVQERRNHLDAVAENDKLRIREHVLERQIRAIASATAAQQYPNASNNENRNYQNTGFQGMNFGNGIEEPLNPFRYNDPSNSQIQIPRKELERKELKYKELEIDNEGFQLSIDTMRIQLQEQRENNSEIIESLNSEFEAYREVTAKELSEKTRKIDSLEEELAKIKNNYRENLHDLMVARKAAEDSKHSVKQDTLVLKAEIISLQRKLDAEIEKSRFMHSSSASNFFGGTAM